MGCLRSFQPVMYCRIFALRSFTEVKIPRRMACRSMIPNQTSTRFSLNPEVGVKWAWNLGFFVVYHQVQFDTGVGAVELA